MGRQTRRGPSKPKPSFQANSLLCPPAATHSHKPRARASTTPTTPINLSQLTATGHKRPTPTGHSRHTTMPTRSSLCTTTDHKHQKKHANSPSRQKAPLSSSSDIDDQSGEEDDLTVKNQVVKAVAVKRPPKAPAPASKVNIRQSQRQRGQSSARQYTLRESPRPEAREAL